MKRLKAFGVARLGVFALFAAALTCLTACGESWHADSESLNKMAESGRRIVRAIIMADSQGPYRGYAWPSDEAGRYDGMKPNKGPNMYQSFETTSDYFTEALYLNAIDKSRQARMCVLKDCSKDDISFGEVDCAWYIATNVRQAAGNTPVLVSRNVNVDVLCNTLGDDASVGAEELLEDVPPFGKEGCVIIYKDGSARTFTADDVNMRNIVPGMGNYKLSDIRQGENPFRFLP